MVLAGALMCLGAQSVYAEDIAPEQQTGPSVPTAPTFHRMMPGGEGEIVFEWVPTNGATGYNVYRRNAETGVYERIGEEPTVSGGGVSRYVDEGLASNTQYSYRISAVNGSGETRASDPVSAVTIKSTTSTTTDTEEEEMTETETNTESSTSTESTVEEDVTEAESEENDDDVTVSGLQGIINSLLSQVAALQAKLTAALGGDTGNGNGNGGNGNQNQHGARYMHRFEHSLSLGVSSDEVGDLQEFLKAQGAEIYPEGLVTGYFGELTRKAVGRFQIKHGVVISENDEGYGHVGPKTRAKINELLGL
jgi:peptidoglycan hydrolase-like protein with peptidoglycan-binding domain